MTEKKVKDREIDWKIGALTYFVEKLYFGVIKSECELLKFSFKYNIPVAPKIFRFYYDFASTITASLNYLR